MGIVEVRPGVASTVWRHNSGKLVVRASTGTPMTRLMTDAQFHTRYGSTFRPAAAAQNAVAPWHTR